MILIAHAGHYALGFIEALPLVLVAAFAVWQTRLSRRRGRHERMGATGSHP